jgi:ADP-heptose:LPS heptosyltransferase
MGYGDDVMATGLARGAASRGKRIAFGDGSRIIWGPYSRDIFRGNPNIAPPGAERAADIEWIGYYKGRRIYNQQGPDRWVWNYDFSPVPGEIMLDQSEQDFASAIEPGFVLLEPNIPSKHGATNKDWGLANYQAVADSLRAAGYRVAQFGFGARRLKGAEIIATQTFRQALAVLSRAQLAILPEGGLHHGAAAVDVPAVVLFGGFIPPKVTGYAGHTNLTGGATACGSWYPCRHCRDALAAISADTVFNAAMEHLTREVRNRHSTRRA